MKVRNSFLQTSGLPSPDLNPVDHRICGIKQDQVHQTTGGNVLDLRQHLIDTWNSLSQSTVDDAVDKWQKKPQACGNEKRDSEHLL